MEFYFGKQCAAVLACAALEDSLKRYARQNNLSVDDKPIQEAVSALKAKGLVSGAKKTLLDTMLELRDHPICANWEEFSDADTGSINGFVEQFVINKFS
jgi:hypothetical protein